MPEHWSDRSRSPPRRASPAARSQHQPQHQPRPPYRSRSRSPDRPREFQGAAARRPSPSHAQGRDVYPHQQHRSPPAPHFSRYEGAGHDYERSRSRPFSDQYSSYQQQQPRDKEDAGRWRQFDAPLHHQQQPPPPQQQPYRHNEAPPSPTLMLRGLAPAVHDAMIMQALASFQPLHSRIIMNKGPGGGHRGFAFVNFASVDDATRVMQAFAHEPLVLEHQPVSFVYADNSRLIRRDQHHGGGFAPPPFDQTGPPRADWICTQCHGTNFARRTFCFKCDLPRAENAQEVPPGTTGGGFRGPMDTSSAPDNECETPSHVLVVRMLPLDIEEGELQVVFAEFEGVRDIRLIRDRATNLSRGFGFIEFADTECAAKALSKGADLMVQGARVRLSYARDTYNTNHHGKFQHQQTPYDQTAPGSSGHVVNSIAATALEQAQWSLANGYAAAQQQQDQQSSMMDDVNALLTSAAAAVIPHIEEPKKRFPLPFETGGGSYVYASDSGLYYDPDSMFYYHVASKMYYNQFTGVYYKCLDGSLGSQATFEQITPPVPVDDTKVGEHPTKPTTSSQGISMQLSSKKDKKKPAISFGIKMAPRTTAMVSSIVALASATTGVKRKSALDIAKWSQLQRTNNESGQLEQKSAPQPSSSAPATTSTPKKPTNKPIAKADTTPSSVVDALMGAAAVEAPICLLCRRKFSSLELLRKHETLSKLHLDNVAKAKQNKELIAAEQREREQQQRREQELQERNEASKRQRTSETTTTDMFAAGSVAASTKVSTAAAPGTAGALESGIGGKMLKMMGWKAGEGLGKHGTGITAPIQASLNANAGRENAGIGSKSTLTANMDHSDATSAKERLQQLTRARYDRDQQP